MATIALIETADTITTGVGDVVTVSASVDTGVKPVFYSPDNGRRLAAERDDLGVWTAAWATSQAGDYPIRIEALGAAPVVVVVTVTGDGPPAPDYFGTPLLDQAYNARDAAIGARNGAITARDEARTARNEAQVARGGAQAARAGAQAAQAGAQAAQSAAEGLVIADLETTDGQTRALIDAADSATRRLLDSEFVAKGTQALPAPTMQRVTRAEVEFGTPRFIESFDGYLWGVDGAAGDIYRSTDGVTWQPYCNSWPGVGAEGFIGRLLPTSDGEVLAMSGHELRKSTGWANGNAATWSASKVVPAGSCIFTGGGFDGDGTKFIVNEYNSTPADWDQSRYAHISTDSGATWTMRYDSQALHGLAASNESHLHGVCYDPWADVFYNGEGHGAAGGVYYSLDDGLTWAGPLNVSDTDTNAPTVIKATDNGIVMGSDNGLNGLFGMLRKPDPSDQVITRTWAFKTPREGLIAFAQSAFRDPATGMVFISFRSEFNDTPVTLAAGTAASGGLVYELPDLPVIGGVDRFSAIGKIGEGRLLVYGEIQGVPHHFIGEVGQPGQGADVLDDGNLGGGGTGGRTSALAVGRSSAAFVQATAAGQGAKAGAAGATAFGYNAQAASSSATSVGQSVTAGEGAVAVGALAAAGNGSVAIGYDADAGANGTAYGAAAVAVGAGVALGETAYAVATSVAVGRSASAPGVSATAVGDDATATASSTALGKSASALNGGVAIGQNAVGNDGVALGFGATVNPGHAGSVALGSGTSTTGGNQVMVGARDLEVQTSGRGLVLVSPNGERWRLAVSNAGATVWNGLG